jgi:hypothetical protein
MEPRWLTASRWLLAAAIALLFTAPLLAGPKVIEESTRIPPPPPPAQFFPGIRISVDGNRLAVMSGMLRYPYGDEVHVYERASNGTWTLVGKVDEATPGSNYGAFLALALKGTTLAVAWPNELRIFDLTSSGWQRTATLTTPSGSTAMGADVGFDGATIVVGARSASALQAVVYQKNASGNWVYTSTLAGADLAPNSGGNLGHFVAISGDTIAMVGGDQVRVFTRSATGTWPLSATLVTPPGVPSFGAGSSLALDGNRLAVPAFDGRLHLFVRSGGVWGYETSVRNPDTLALAYPGAIRMSGNLIAQQFGDDDRLGSVMIWEHRDSKLAPVAELFPSINSLWSQGLPGFTGRTLITPALYVYELPQDLSQPAPIADDFSVGNASEWTRLPSNGWSVVSSGGSSVYRQTSLDSDAHSIRDGTDFTNQSIQADVKPIAFNGADRWFGLAVRYTDASNYYYLTARSSGTLQLRKMLNGTFTTLASAPISIAANETYRLRLEAVGTRIRGFVNGRMLVEAIEDRSHSHGRAGLMMYKTQAEYDNVLVTPNMQDTLFSDDFTWGATSERWTKSSGTWVDPPDLPPDPDSSDPDASRRVFAQTSTSGDARASAGEPNTVDQVVQAKVIPKAFATPTAWFGLMARHTDDRNYYYVKLDGNGQLSLRKLVNGAIFELDSATLPVSIGTAYVLRLEATADKLRAYVNGQFLLEATDSTFSAGRYGLVTYKAAADFDDVVVLGP